MVSTKHTETANGKSHTRHQVTHYTKVASPSQRHRVARTMAGGLQQISAWETLVLLPTIGSKLTLISMATSIPNGPNQMAASQRHGTGSMLDVLEDHHDHAMDPSVLILSSYLYCSLLDIYSAATASLFVSFFSINTTLLSLHNYLSNKLSCFCDSVFSRINSCFSSRRKVLFWQQYRAFRPRRSHLLYQLHQQQ